MKLNKREKAIVNILAIFMTLMLCSIIVGIIFIWLFFISEYLGGYWAFVTLIFVISIIVYLFNKE